MEASNSTNTIAKILAKIIPNTIKGFIFSSPVFNFVKFSITLTIYLFKASLIDLRKTYEHLGLHLYGFHFQ